MLCKSHIHRASISTSSKLLQEQNYFRDITTINIKIIKGSRTIVSHTPKNYSTFIEKVYVVLGNLARGVGIFFTSITLPLKEGVICLKCIYSFLMLHACLYTICFVFCYTSWHFYAFSGTNQLTRCHSASSLFSAVFVFQKSYTGNILGIGRNKSQSSFFSRDETESKVETKGDQGPATPWGGATSP
jgi:hypothetical protein